MPDLLVIDFEIPEWPAFSIIDAIQEWRMIPA